MLNWRLESQIVEVVSSITFISLKYSKFSLRYIEFLSNILEPSPVKTKIDFSFLLLKSWKSIFLNIKLIISSNLAKITSSRNLFEEFFGRIFFEKFIFKSSASFSEIFRTLDISLVILLPPNGKILINYV